ncbi:MAG: nuclear transport factor 2 family protein [Flavobacteriaceae bacterium]
MKTIITLILALVLVPSTDKDKEGVTTALNYYMEGAMNRDFNTLKEAFHEDAIMTIADASEGTFKQVNAREFFSKMKPGEPLKRTNKIVSISIKGQTAVAQLHIEDDEKIFHDFMTLQKLKDRWYIVNKSFYREMK